MFLDMVNVVENTFEFSFTTKGILRIIDEEEKFVRTKYVQAISRSLRISMKTSI
jgi:hypothetical protein